MPLIGMETRTHLKKCCLAQLRLLLPLCSGIHPTIFHPLLSLFY